MDPIKQLLNVPPAGTASLTLAELVSLCQAKNQHEWNAVVEEILAARGGAYPPEWHSSVQASGLHYEIVSRWTLRDGVLTKLTPDGAQ